MNKLKAILKNFVDGLRDWELPSDRIERLRAENKLLHSDLEEALDLNRRMRTKIENGINVRKGLDKIIEDHKALAGNYAQLARERQDELDGLYKLNAQLTARINELNTKDSVKTKEINILTQENRTQHDKILALNGEAARLTVDRMGMSAELNKLRTEHTKLEEDYCTMREELAKAKQQGT